MSRFEEIVKKLFKDWEEEMDTVETGDIKIIYIPEKYYHIIDENNMTLCGIAVLTPRNKLEEDEIIGGRWVTGPQLQAERSPCPKCIKESMELPFNVEDEY